MVRTLPQRADRQGRGVCDGEGEGLRHVLGGGVPARDGVRRDEDADAASGPRARGDALQGVERHSVAQQRDPPETALQGAAVQLFRFSEGGRAPHEHGSPVAGGDVAVFGIVKGECGHNKLCPSRRKECA